MTRREIRDYKKLISVYKQCIDACSFSRKTKHFRNRTQNKIEKVSGLLAAAAINE